MRRQPAVKGRPPTIRVRRRVLDSETYVPGLVTWLSNKLSAGASRLYREHFDLGVIDWRMLATLAAEPDATSARICEIVGLDKAAVSRSFTLLERRHLIEVRWTPGRSRPASLTREGWAIHDAILGMALARQERLLAPLAPAERDVLVGLLHRLLQQVPATNDWKPR